MKNILLIMLTMLASMTTNAQEHVQNPPSTKHSKPVFLQPTCEGKLASVLLSSFRDAISTSQGYELVSDLSDNGKMDAVVIIQMACGESHGAVSVGSIYGVAKCLGVKNCHVSLDGHTLNVLMCDPNGEAVCGRELVKEFEYVLATIGLMGTKVE